ncbi:MAG TPA: PQQ-dependent sugar dehydrogenase [Blastocatellia bacterium]|nr:PQQ-dependent sugar dehydrogenase [Blastocatellia bacterium]
MNRRNAGLLFCLALLCAICPALFGASASQKQSRELSSVEVTPNLVPIQLTPVVEGLSSPVYVTNARDGSNRLFIVEQGGIIKVLQPGSSAPTVFLNITSRVLSGGERGLLGLAFHPDYETNRRFFVNYTRQTDGATVIAEYRTSAGNPNVADMAERVFLVIPQPFANHNGGMIEFGPDGFLYIGMGDGGSANDPGNRAQNIEDLLGKMLRIDVDTPNGSVPYSSPMDNPFFGPAAGRDEIYAYGFRNPFRWSFDRQTGTLWMGDVGQGQREEINNVTLGGNYGWRIFEGTICTGLGPTPCASCGCIGPVGEYSHSGGRCSITGGYVYRGARQTLPLGTYLFADFCTGEIFRLNGSTPVLLIDTNLSVASFGEDEAGELYVVNLGGSVLRIINPNNSVDTVGVFRPTDGTVFLRNQNTSGVADVVITYGVAQDIPFAGDFNGDGIDSIGIYRNGNFFLRNANTSGNADLTFAFGSAGDLPVVGDWNGDGVDTVGVFRNGTFFLRNTNSSGPPDLVFTFGGAGDLPLAGDWDGDGNDTVGVYRSSNSVFFLRNSNNSGVANITITFGVSSDKPVIGDWNGDGVDTIGVYRNGTFFLRNSNTSGNADITFSLGVERDVPIAGDWNARP